MRLKKITVSNFRGFERLEVDLHPRLTVLVGDNGAGKTAVLDAIAVGLSPILRHLSSANQRLRGIGIRDADFRLVPQEVRGGRTRWVASDAVQVLVEAAGGLAWDVWRRSSSTASERGHRLGETALIEYLRPIAEGLGSETAPLLPVFAYYGARRGYIQIPERLRATQENYDHPTSALVGALEPLSDFKEMLKWFDAEEAAELRAARGADEDNPPDSSRALNAVRAALRGLLGGQYHHPSFNRDHKFVVESVQGGVPLQVSQLSQGYQSMLALGLDFARRLALGNPQLEWVTPETMAQVWRAWEEVGQPVPPERAIEFIPDSPALLAPAIMLIDEVDLHLHPSWQQRVMKDLLVTFPATQFIVTTHSPQVLSTVRKENIRVLGSAVDGRMVAVPPLASPYGEPSSTVLQSVMHVDPQPPVPEKSDLDRLTVLVDQGAFGSEEAVRLMRSLTETLGDHHPQLQRLSRSVRRQEALKG